MQADEFEFDRRVVDAVDERQRAVLHAVRDLIHRLAPAELDLAATKASTAGGELFVELPHRSRDGQVVAAIVGSDESTVFYGVERFAFWSDDPVHGRRWPLDAEDHQAAALALLTAILAGRVELEIHDGVLGQRATSYLVDADGTRDVFFRSHTFRLQRRKAEPELVRFDFGTRG